MKLLKYLFFSVILHIAINSIAQQGQYRRIELFATPDSIKSWQEQELLPSHFHYKDSLLEMELTNSELKQWLKKKISFTDISESRYNLPVKDAAGIDSPQMFQPTPSNFTYGSMGGYYTYAEAMAALDDMRIKFPLLVSAKDTIGWTYEGRPIVAVRISDNPEQQENDEDEWLMTAMHHANEVMGEQVVIYFAWYLLEHYESDKELKTLLNNSALYIIPVVNPDGLVYNETTNPTGGGGWRKNRKPRVISSTTHYGVDLNRNYGFNRAYTHPGILGQAGSSFAGNDYYRGTAAWSEAETSAIRDFCKKHRFTAAFNYHAWDDSFNYPWNFDIDSLTPDHLKYQAIAAYCTSENHFEYGTFNRTLGYTANGTSDDWLYGEQVEKNKIFAFTIEVGKSFWPSQTLIGKYCDSLLPANLKMMRMAAKYAPAEETSADTISTLSHYISYDLKRYSITDTSFTVSLTAIDPIISSTEADKVYPNLSFLSVMQDTIHYLLSPAITNGTAFRFLLKVDNGKWSVTDTITKVYRASSTLAIDCADNYEPNNTRNQAAIINSGQEIVGAIDDESDEDWYSFETNEAAKNIRLVLSNLPADYDLELFNAAGTKVAAATQPHKRNDTLVFNDGMPGRFKVRIYGYRTAHQPSNCYRLNFTSSSNHFKLPLVAIGKNQNPVATNISVFPTPATDLISVTTTLSARQNINWVIADISGSKIKSGRAVCSNGTNTFSLSLQGLSAGIYILQVTSDKSGKLLSGKIVKQ